MSYHLGVNPGAGPPDQQPPDPSRAATRRYVWVVASLLVVVGLATSAVASGLRDDDAEAATTDTTDTTDPDKQSTTSSTAGGDDTTSSTTTGGTTDTVTLTADDWGPEARAEWVDQCVNTDIGTAGELGGQSPDETCGCIYDQIEQGDLSFEDFRDGVGSDADIDPSSDIGVAMTSAAVACGSAAGI